MAYNQPTGGKAVPGNAVSYQDWLNTMNTASKPIMQTVDLFAPGGGYGKGQLATIQSEAQKGQASAMSNLVSTGMSSGTNVLGATQRVRSDAAKAKLAVEDERTKMYAQALQQLAALREATATGQFNWAGLNQQGTLGNRELDIRQWANTISQPTTQSRGAGGGLSPWDPTWGQPKQTTETTGGRVPGIMR